MIHSIQCCLLSVETTSSILPWKFYALSQCVLFWPSYQKCWNQVAPWPTSEKKQHRQDPSVRGELHSSLQPISNYALRQSIHLIDYPTCIMRTCTCQLNLLPSSITLTSNFRVLLKGGHSLHLQVLPALRCSLFWYSRHQHLQSLVSSPNFLCPFMAQFFLPCSTTHGKGQHTIPPWMWIILEE